jgi:hypothetical protein
VSGSAGLTSNSNDFISRVSLFIQKLKGLGKDADNFARFAVDNHAASQYSAIGAEMRTPIAI